MTSGQGGLQPYAGVFAAMEGFSKGLPKVDPNIFQIQEIMGAQMKAALEPLHQSVVLQIQSAMEPLIRSMNAQLQGVSGIFEIQRQMSEALAPAMRTFGQLRLPNLTPVADAMAAMDLAKKLPDLSVLGHLGELASSGEFAPEFVQRARDAVDAVDGYADEITAFSVRETVASVFDAKTISEGTYIFVFIVWLIGSLWVAGLSEEAKTLSDLIGLSGMTGSHSVAKFAYGKAKKVVIKKGDTRRR